MNHHIFSQTYQKLIFLPPPLTGRGGELTNIHPCKILNIRIREAEMKRIQRIQIRNTGRYSLELLTQVFPIKVRMIVYMENPIKRTDLTGYRCNFCLQELCYCYLLLMWIRISLVRERK